MIDKDKNKLIRADLSLLLVVAIWGTTFPVMKMALGDIKPFYFIALRFAVALLVLTLIFYKKLTALNGTNLKKGSVLGLWLLSGYVFQIVGLQYTTASRSGFITGLSVVIVPLLAVIILKEVPKRLTALGVLIATIGLFLLTGISSGGIFYGDYLTLLGAFSFAMHIVLVSKYIKGENPVIMTWVQIAVVALGGFLLALFEGEISAVELNTGWVIIYTGLLATALAYLIQNHAQQYTTSTHTGLIFTLEPVFGAFFSWLILQELMGWSGIAGGLLIISGMLLTELGDAGERPQNEGSEAVETD